MSFDDVLDERMKLFDKFLSYRGLDKKKYQEVGSGEVRVNTKKKIKKSLSRSDA
jgi:hypothetical protein